MLMQKNLFLDSRDKYNQNAYFKNIYSNLKNKFK